MNEKFLKLTPEKQKILLQVICEEFAHYSYEDASTNRIVEKAGISKGTLFNYFGSKKNMYQDLLRYVLDNFKEYAIFDFPTDDFIQRCYLLAKKKMETYQEAPHILEFLAMVHVNDHPHVPSQLKERMVEMMEKTMTKLYTDVDVALFRQDIPATDLMRMIRLMFDGHTQEMTALLKNGVVISDNFDQWMDEYEIFLKQMKQIFYK